MTDEDAPTPPTAGDGPATGPGGPGSPGGPGGSAAADTPGGRGEPALADEPGGSAGSGNSDSTGESETPGGPGGTARSGNPGDAAHRVIRLVVADDHEVVRAGFAGLLATQPDFEVVGTARDGVEAVRVCRERRPDVVLMDVRMPGVDGIEATARLAATGDDPPPRVLILTTFDLDEYVYEALAAGASGFLLKDVTAERLFDAVRVVAAGEALLAPAVTRRLIAEFARLRPRTAPGGTATAGPGAPDRTPAPTTAPARRPPLAALTPRETEVLRLLAEGLSNPELAVRLQVSEETVKTHISRLLAKLNLRDRTQAVVAAYESGLVVPGRPTPAPDR